MSEANSNNWLEEGGILVLNDGNRAWVIRAVRGFFVDSSAKSYRNLRHGMIGPFHKAYPDDPVQGWIRALEKFGTIEILEDYMERSSSDIGFEAWEGEDS